MYKIKKNDLVICKPAEDKRTSSNIDFEIYARVVKVDRKKDILLLDQYQKQGRLYITFQSNKPLSLSATEHNAYYQPMNTQEIADFLKGLQNLMARSRPSHERSYIYLKHTLRVVSETYLKIRGGKE